MVLKSGFNGKKLSTTLSMHNKNVNNNEINS